MDGTSPLIVNRVQVINRTHMFAAPMQSYWPPLQFDRDAYPVPGFPRLFMTDICTGSDHITFHQLDDWTVTAGVFDPFDLYANVLSRYSGVNAQATQQLPQLSTGVTYQISVSGDVVVSFSGGSGTQYSWNTNSKTITDQQVDVTFTTDTPDVISVKFNNNTQQLDAITMTNMSTNEQVLSNSDFTQTHEHFYDIEGWYVDSADPTTISPDTLGYLQGFNDVQLFTIFE